MERRWKYARTINTKWERKCKEIYYSNRSRTYKEGRWFYSY